MIVVRHRTLWADVFLVLAVLGWTSSYPNSGFVQAADEDAAIAPEVLQKRVATLIKQLGHDKYVLRQRAQNELTEIGAVALDALTRALEDDDIEIVMRARYLLSAIDVQWSDPEDPASIRELVKDYGKIKNEKRRSEVMEELAEVENLVKLKVLCRIIRYERSLPLSKKAALLVIELLGDKTIKEGAKQMLAHLEGSQRPAANWLRVFVQSQDKPKQLAERWKQITDAERKLWSDASTLTNYSILQELLFKLADLLEAAGRSEDAAPYLKQIVELQPADDSESIRTLVEWLLKKKAHSLIVAVSEKFPEAFQRDSMLLYALAFAHRETGQDAIAAQTAKRALTLKPGDAEWHYTMAYELQQRGWFTWAEDEYGQVIENSLANQYGIASAVMLSEMHHDQHQEQKAGDVLKTLIVGATQQPPVRAMLQRTGRKLAGLQSRMNYFYACHHQAKGELKEQIKLLDTAIGEDPSDADVLIALYRLPNQDESRKASTIARINSAATVFRQQIAANERRQSPSSTPYNQFAWLIGNTLGETDKELAGEAIKYSHKSLELRPNAAGYLDTLGRCYYAAGDLEKAILYQSRSAKLDPHSGLINSQLQLFKEKQAEVEGKK
jgi:tetratricopeptide (TPR) repeat protein